MNSGAGFGAPTVAQPATNVSNDRIRLNRSYLFSLSGILRLCIIIFQFAGWVAAAAVPKGLGLLPDSYMATRGGYLFFSIVGFILSLMFYVFYLFNLVNVNLLSKIPWGLVTLGHDVLWIIPTFVLSIVCAVREAGIKDPTFLFSNFINVGAFGAAAFFGFLCTILYAVHSGYSLMKLKRGNNSTPNYTP